MSAALSRFSTLAEFGTVAESTLLARWTIVELASSMNRVCAGDVIKFSNPKLKSH